MTQYQFRIPFLLIIAGCFWNGTSRAAGPGTPALEFGPKEVGLSLFLTYSGQDLFKASNEAASALYQGGASLDYGIAPWLQMGVFGGGADLNHAVPEQMKNDTRISAFDAEYAPFGGLSLKVVSPRFISSTTAFYSYGNVSYASFEDDFGVSKKTRIYNTGAGFQFRFGAINWIIGGNYFLIEGKQSSLYTGQVDEPFANQGYKPGTAGAIRGLVGMEIILPKKQNALRGGFPYIGIYLMPTGESSWEKGVGIKNSAISFSIGFISSTASQKDEDNLDENLK